MIVVAAPRSQAARGFRGLFLSCLAPNPAPPTVVKLRMNSMPRLTATLVLCAWLSLPALAAEVPTDPPARTAFAPT